MSAPKFTPGPWVVAQRQLPSDTVHADSVDLLRMDGYAINVPRDTLSDYPEADIALIAAAPDLYAALADLLAHYVELVECGDAGNWDANKESQVIAARAALAKAEGRS